MVRLLGNFGGYLWAAQHEFLYGSHLSASEMGYLAEERVHAGKGKGASAEEEAHGR